MILTFFNQYKNNKIEKSKFTNYTKEETVEYEMYENNELDYDMESDLKDLYEKIKATESIIKDDIAREKFKVDNFFDSELFKNLNIMNNFIKQYMPDYYEDYDEGYVSGQSYLDAMDIIQNELPISVDEILHSVNNISGIVNDTKINIENGFQIDEIGNVYNPSRQIIFNPADPSTEIKFIDILNNKFVTTEGIRIELPLNFIEDNFLNNPNIPNDLKDKYKDKLENIINSDVIKNGNDFKVDDNEKEIIGMVQGIPVYKDEELLMKMELEDVFVGDIFEEVSSDKPIDFINQFKNYRMENDDFSMCNFKDIPYAELNSLLFWGGGERGVKPLASNEISSKDIQFKPDGTVYYSGSNSTVSTKRPGCPSRKFKTGHVCMYSESNKMGLKRSIIQYIFGFCNTFGIFNANIPPLIGFKKFKVFPGLCIGGLLEQILCGWQERISKKINAMFQCVPAKLVSDNSETGFENETFPYGSSVKTIEELDHISSCKVGDRYVVDVVGTEITGNKNPACGVFVFDPQGTMEKTFKWKYKNWRGKPFKPEDNNNTIKVFDINNPYNNPIVQDILMETNALGTDSITRKLMSLQYAFAKKESLLSITDVNYSMDELISNTIDEVIGKLTNQLSQFLIMKHFHEQYESQENGLSNYNKYERIGYIKEFQKHFSYLTSNGSLKQVPLEKCKRTKNISSNSSGSNNSSSTSITIEYYDFSGYNKDEYLVPVRENVEYYDLIMFSNMFIPSDQLIEAIKNNIGYLNSLNADVNKFINLKTIREYINKSENKEAYEKNITDNLKYIEADLNYNGFEPEAFEQVNKRCYFTIDKANIFGGKL